jgi:aryl-alcohol dehydrogenase-like predicted oxidoreductase
VEATSPAALKNYLAQSLQRLGTEYIDIDSLGAGERKGHRAPGRKRDHLDESLGALDIELSQSDVEQIERIVPPGTVAGTRYNAYLMG